MRKRKQRTPKEPTLKMNQNEDGRLMMSFKNLKNFHGLRNKRGKITLFLVMTFIYFLGGNQVSLAEKKSQEETNIKIAYVDMQRAIQMTSLGKEAREVLETEFKKKQQEFKEKEEELKKKSENLKKRQALLSKGVFEKERLQFQEEFLQFQKQVDQSSVEIQNRERDLLSPILNSLGKVLDQIAKKGRYTMILDRSKQGIVWAKQEIDLTEQLVSVFEKENNQKKKNNKNKKSELVM